MATSTPWGPSQYKHSHGRGINFYGCAGHGGIKVSKALNASMPDLLRLEDGWYEEDDEYARVVIAFPDRFTDKELDLAKKSFANWHPEAYEQLFGLTLQPGESRKRDEDVFYREHGDSLISTSAYGDGFKGVPKGMVVVTAVKGGYRHRQHGSEQNFLLTEQQYHDRGPFGLVIDPVVHQVTDIQPGY